MQIIKITPLEAKFRFHYNFVHIYVDTTNKRGQSGTKDGVTHLLQVAPMRGEFDHTNKFCLI